MGKTDKGLNTTLLHMYGVSLSNMDEKRPIFGSGVKLALTMGSLEARQRHLQLIREQRPLDLVNEGGAEMLPPTLLNLLWHFGEMQWVIDNIATLVRQSKGTVQAKHLDERFFISAQDRQRELFERQRVLPLRKALLDARYPMFFYCVPSVSIETELVTGKPLITEGDRVLCVLPKTVQIAQHFKYTESEIRLLAPQVIWTIKMMCTFRAIKSADELRELAGDWARYLTTEVLTEVQSDIKRQNPHLITPQVTQQLLLPFE